MGIEVQKARGNEIIYRTPDGPIHIKAWDVNGDNWYVSLNGPDRYPNGSPRQVTCTLCIGAHPRVDIEAFVQTFAKIYEAASAPKPPKSLRELPDLDCKEARDGTVWADSDKGFPFHYRFRGSRWEYFALDGARRWSTLDESHSLSSYGPYTEVVE